MIIFVHTVQHCHKKYIFTQGLHANNLFFTSFDWLHWKQSYTQTTTISYDITIACFQTSYISKSWREFQKIHQRGSTQIYSHKVIDKIDKPEIIAIFKTLFIPPNSEQQNLGGYNGFSNRLLKCGVERRLWKTFCLSSLDHDTNRPH